jgi:hypothetical protein
MQVLEKWNICYKVLMQGLDLLLGTVGVLLLQDSLNFLKSFKIIGGLPSRLLL